jgi:hypothetical protein
VTVRTEPNLQEAIPSSGVVVDVFVEAENPKGYTLFDGNGYQFFAEQPIRGITIYPQVTYTVYVSDTDVGCSFGNLPTGLPRLGQPVERRSISLPFIVN